MHTDHQPLISGPTCDVQEMPLVWPTSQKAFRLNMKKASVVLEYDAVESLVKAALILKIHHLARLETTCKVFSEHDQYRFPA